MPDRKIERLKAVDNFESLVSYLRDELDWPIEVGNADDITFDYEPEDLNIDEKHAAKIKNIKQIRPLTDDQPWGIFYIEFEPKKLPIGVMRRILKALIHKKRSYDDKKPTWKLHDLMFISSLGEIDERKISFAHFTETEEGIPELRTFSWDKSDTHLHYCQSRLDLDKLRWPDNDQDSKNWQNQWSSAFRLRYREVIRTSQQLAVEMAHLAAHIRDKIKEVYGYEISNGPLHNLFNNFKRVLIHDLDINNFADMYAQTIAYGLFSARATHEGEFIFEDIPAMIPNTNPFLKKLFEECTNIGKSSKEDDLDLDEIGVTDLIKTLKESNIEAVLADFGRQKQGEDPVVHFYELFLREYDVDQKVKRGVFYTPDPVVSFIVRSVDSILKTDFHCQDGLADTSKTIVKKIRPKKKGKGYIEDDRSVHKVQILDPAVGTGTFLKHSIDIIKKNFDEKNENVDEEILKEKWNEYVINDLFPRLFGFELMMAPYAVCHLKLGLELAETGYDFKTDKRLGVFLTNTLEGTHKGAGTLDAYFNWLAEEGHKANLIKAKNQINVIIGNPPYSGHSANDSQWSNDLIRGKAFDDTFKRNYFEVDGESLNERNPKWLNDDYVKFIRFAQWRIDKTGQGVLAFITNHSYLDNPTFRGMRQQLMETFSDIYLLNLHGSSIKKEKTPDGTKDENVFDIRPGVSIGIFVKNPNKNKTQVFLKDIFGSRDEKYKYLLNKNIENIKWEIIPPSSPDYLFKKQDLNLKSEYEKGRKLTDIFELYGVGMTTARDYFVIDMNKDDLAKRILNFKNSKLSDEELHEYFKIKKKKGWSIRKAWNQLQSIPDSRLDDYIIPVLYRPFDIRWIFYHDSIVWRTVKKIMLHMIEDNVGLITLRRSRSLDKWKYVFPSQNVIAGATPITSLDINYLFPLYVYDKIENKKCLKNNNTKFSRKNNIKPDFIDKLSKEYGYQIKEDHIFYYIYSVLYSDSFRTKYNKLLIEDFPRIPFTANYNLFCKLSNLGKQLISLHLLKSEKIDDNFLEFKGEGDNKIASITYKDKTQKLFINKSQYFDGISNELYNFYFGGYRTCEKWLKDRKNKKLTYGDIEHYQKIISSIKETIKTMVEIDKLIEENGGWPIK